MSKSYDDIIHLPHHVSATRPPMPMADRAAQFSPFAALTGYSSAILETARLTDSRTELDESEKETINRRLRYLADHPGEELAVTVSCFRPDQQKEGGAFVTISGVVRKLDEYERVLILRDGRRIPFEDIYGIEA